MCYELSPEVFLSFAAIFSVDLRIAKQNIHIKRISVFVLRIYKIQYKSLPHGIDIS